MASRLYGSRWQKLRLRVLDEDEHRCQIGGDGCTGEATEVDHIIPVLVDPSLELVRSNLRSSCRACNLGRRNGRVSVNRPSREW